MTNRGGALLAILFSALFCALALGERVFYWVTLFSALTLLYALASVWCTRARFRVSCALSAPHTPRGESVQLTLRLSRRGLLPVEPAALRVRAGETETLCWAALSPRAETTLNVEVPSRHVGAFSCGVTEARVGDPLGLFSLKLPCRGEDCTLLVLPRAFELSPLTFPPGDDGRALPNRTSEDLSAPEDTRAYRAGDALKRIHWKLSVRKRELIVRRFEMPAPPDTLILLDCAAPAEEDAERARGLRDTLCETALSVAVMQMKTGSPVRVPFYGGAGGEFAADHNDGLLAEMLACQSFTGDVAFSLALQLELRRMRRTGAAVIITSRLDANIVEGVKRIRRMGPNARVYLATYTPEAPQDRPYVTQLLQCMVEVCYVTPA